jgi:hypothetical protein
VVPARLVPRYVKTGIALFLLENRTVRVLPDNFPAAATNQYQ